MSIEAGAKAIVENKYLPIHINARTADGKTVLSGRDFYGFGDADRSEELGFKKVEADQITLCQK